LLVFVLVVRDTVWVVVMLLSSFDESISPIKS
jgi:hypothetical protein